MIAVLGEVKTLGGMNAGQEQCFPVQISAALDWWRDAGVDCDFADAATSWLAPKELPQAQEQPARAPAAAQPARQPVPAAPALPAIGGDPAIWPQDLGSFAAWWLAEPSLDGGMVMDRVPPRGVAGAELMILVAEPEAEDRETLLSGPQGKLVAAMLRAMGIAPDRTYLASALPRRTPAADWAALTAAGMGAVVRHHAALAAPKRLIVFGGNILPLLGNDPPNSETSLRAFNHGGRSVPLMAAPDLQAMLARPRVKAGFWRSWLEWTGTEA